MEEKNVQRIKQGQAEIKEEIKETKGEIKKLNLKAEATEARKEIMTKVITAITTALAVVAAFFWQTAINDTIKTFVPVSGAWQYEIIIAFLVSIAVAVVIYVISKQLMGKTE